MSALSEILKRKVPLSLTGVLSILGLLCGTVALAVGWAVMVGFDRTQSSKLLQEALDSSVEGAISEMESLTPSADTNRDQIAGSLDRLGRSHATLAAAMFAPDGSLFASYSANSSSAESLKVVLETNCKIDQESGEVPKVIRMLRTNEQLIGWRLCVIGDLYRYEQSRMNSRSLLLLLIVFISLCSQVIVVLTSRRLLRPFKELREGLARLGRKHGVSDEDLPVPSDSVEELSRQVDRISRLISQREEDLRVAQDRILSHAEALARFNKQLKHTNVELDQFAYSVSHDLREPLRGISTYVSMLVREKSPALDLESNQKLLTIQELTQRLTTIIEEILHYSRLSRDKLTLTDTDLQRMVDDIIFSMKLLLDHENAKVVISKPLPKLNCDRVRIAEVFRNLIANAIKYNDKPEKQIEVGYLDPDAAEMWLGKFKFSADKFYSPILFVKDNGIGIPERHFQRIFQMFKRLHGRNEYGGGTGAGLSVVQKIIERHGGHVWVESAEGIGTTFYFYFAVDSRMNSLNDTLVEENIYR